MIKFRAIALATAAISMAAAVSPGAKAAAEPAQAAADLLAEAHRLDRENKPAAAAKLYLRLYQQHTRSELAPQALLALSANLRRMGKAQDACSVLEEATSVFKDFAVARADHGRHCSSKTAVASAPLNDAEHAAPPRAAIRSVGQASPTAAALFAEAQRLETRNASAAALLYLKVFGGESAGSGLGRKSLLALNQNFRRMGENEEVCQVIQASDAVLPAFSQALAARMPHCAGVTVATSAPTIRASQAATALTPAQAQGLPPPKDGVEAYNRKDYAAAAKFWNPLALAGDKNSQYNLGLMWENGFGVTADLRNAYNWYHKAAQQGQLAAMVAFARVSMKVDEPTPANKTAALSWLTLAARWDQPDAKRMLVELGQPVPAVDKPPYPAPRPQTVVQQAATPKKKKGGGLLRIMQGAIAGGQVIAGGGGGLSSALTGMAVGAVAGAAGADAGSINNALSTATVGTAIAGGATALQSGGSYSRRPNLLGRGCSGFTDVSGNDVQLKAMCAQASELYASYERAIAQGYSEADANRTYAAHEKAALVANSFFENNRAN